MCNTVNWEVFAVKCFHSPSYIRKLNTRNFKRMRMVNNVPGKGSPSTKIIPRNHFNMKILRFTVPCPLSPLFFSVLIDKVSVQYCRTDFTCVV